MYSLVSAVTRSLDSKGKWSSTDLSNVSFQSIYDTYTGAIVVLSNDILANQSSLDLFSYRSQVTDTTQTVNQFLAGLGNKALPTNPQLPVIKEVYVRYKDTYRAGYHAQAVGRGVAIDAVLPFEDKIDIHLSKDNTDFNLFYQSCLATVNGFIHALSVDVNGAWILDGMKSIFKSGENTLGLLNFQNVAKLEIIPITPDMIYKQSDDQLYRNQMHFKLPQDISQKSLFASIGGYLVPMDDKTLLRTSGNTVVFDMNNYPIWDRFYESLPYLDFSGLPYQKTDTNETQVGVDDFLSDANLVAYLTMSQSFFIIADSPDLYLDRSDIVEKTPIAQTMVGYTKPDRPLISGVGKLTDYWYVYEDQQWAIKARDNVWNRLIIETLPWREMRSISGARRPDRPVQFSRAHYLKIAKNLQMQ